LDIVGTPSNSLDDIKGAPKGAFYYTGLSKRSLTE
jgi:hypothetical protein